MRMTRRRMRTSDSHNNNDEGNNDGDENNNDGNCNDDDNKDNKMTGTTRTRDEDTTIKKRTRTMMDDNDEG